MSPFMLQVLSAIVRAVLQAFGGGAFVFSDADVLKLAGAILSVLTLAWSIAEKINLAAKPEEPS